MNGGGVIHWCGKPVPFRAGESAASALARAGITDLGRAASGLARGVFCGIGQCQNCLVLYQGRPVEACLLPCSDGLRLEPENTGGDNDL